jgi:hypothetical protein
MSEARDTRETRLEAPAAHEDKPAGDEPVEPFPLLVGGVAEAGDLLRDWMRGDPDPESKANEAIRHAAIGLTAKTAEGVERRVRAAAKLSSRFGRLFVAPGRAVGSSRPLSPLRRRFERLVERGEAEVEAWIAKGQETEAQGRHLARSTISRSTNQIVNWVGEEPAVEKLIDKQVARIVPDLAEVPEIDEAIQRLADSYIAYLSQQPPQVLESFIRSQIEWAITDLYQHPPPALRQLVREQVAEILPELLGMPALDELVREVANNYIAFLSEHPEHVQSLIRDQGDVYITYLTQNPEQVQTLIQGQSKGLVSEVTDEVRARTVTADSFVETLARSVLRRGQREQLTPGSPPDEIAEAENEGKDS